MHNELNEQWDGADLKFVELYRRRQTKRHNSGNGACTATLCYGEKHGPKWGKIKNRCSPKATSKTPCWLCKTTNRCC